MKKYFFILLVGMHRLDGSEVVLTLLKMKSNLSGLVLCSRGLMFIFSLFVGLVTQKNITISSSIYEAIELKRRKRRESILFRE